MDTLDCSRLLPFGGSVSAIFTILLCCGWTMDFFDEFTMGKEDR